MTDGDSEPCIKCWLWRLAGCHIMTFWSQLRAFNWEFNVGPVVHYLSHHGAADPRRRLEDLSESDFEDGSESDDEELAALKT